MATISTPVSVPTTPTTPVTPVAPVTPAATTDAVDEITTPIKLKMALIPAGEFRMGNSHTVAEDIDVLGRYQITLKADTFVDEYPRHRVRISKPFYMGKYHVTIGQFRQFVDATGYRTDAERDGQGGDGHDPTTGAFQGHKTQYSWRAAGFPQTDEYPVVNVSWNDAVAFCDWLSRKERATYRLPTEAEWEYACRAGTSTRYANGDDPESLALVGNVADAAFRAKFPDEVAISASDGYVFTAPVGQFRPNAWGLCDMHGNAWQWCSDWYQNNYHASSAIDDPQGPPSGSYHILRGGSWEALPSVAAPPI